MVFMQVFVLHQSQDVHLLQTLQDMLGMQQTGTASHPELCQAHTPVTMGWSIKISSLLKCQHSLTISAVDADNMQGCFVDLFVMGQALGLATRAGNLEQPKQLTIAALLTIPAGSLAS